jgi:phosphopantothenoylcysteine decarboxylase/phosphopantothenate--cysteine ligase
MGSVARIVLGLTGGIAAYKAPELIRLLARRGIEIKVVLTPAARNLVGEETLRTLSGNPVYVDDAPSGYDFDHIRLAEWADYGVICPATANTIAKIAHGIADNLLSTLCLCLGERLMIAPAMNTAMWSNPATQHNIQILSSRGVRVLPVEEGELACGDTGPGRMLPVEAIADHVESLTGPRPLTGKNVLIASGPTREPIDAVRVLTNRSSGAMGTALCRAALALGAQVTVVTGPVSRELPRGIERVDVSTTEEMLEALQGRFESCDVCIMAAAVSDFRPAAAAHGKIHRGESDTIAIELVPNPDIAQSLGTVKKHQILVGFALEQEDPVEGARVKMAKKNCDLMVANAIDSSLGLEDTRVSIVYRERDPEHLPTMGKDSAARRILLRVADLIG